MSSNNNVLITIGMPVYNGAEYLRVALDSLLAQTYGNVELIISDNASTDDTQAICEEYARKDARIVYVRQGENMGALRNFQFVLDKARGEFFMWAAADDRWDEGWVESLFNLVRAQKDTAGFGRLVHIDAHGEVLKHPANDATLRFHGMPLWRKLRFYLPYEGLGKANLFYALYPREALQRIGLGGSSIDYQIIFRWLDRFSYAQAKEPRLYKRIHGGCDGGAGQSIFIAPVILAPARLILRDCRIAAHYLQNTSPGLAFVLMLLLPVKIALALGFHAYRSGLLLSNRWCRQW